MSAKVLPWLISVVFLFGFPGATAAGGAIPAGARIIFEDDFPAGLWKGAEVAEGASLGIAGRALVPLAYGDTVPLERKVDFELEKGKGQSHPHPLSGSESDDRGQYPPQGADRLYRRVGSDPQAGWSLWVRARGLPRGLGPGRRGALVCLHRPPPAVS